MYNYALWWTKQYLTICFLGELFRTRIPKTVKNDKEKGGSRKVKGKKKRKIGSIAQQRRPGIRFKFLSQATNLSSCLSRRLSKFTRAPDIKLCIVSFSCDGIARSLKLVAKYSERIRTPFTGNTILILIKL